MRWAVAATPAWYEQLRALREARGISQDGWAARLGYGRRTLQRWESGAVVPDAAAEEALVALCTELGAFRTDDHDRAAGARFDEQRLRALLAQARLGVSSSDTESQATPEAQALRTALRKALPPLPRPLTSFIGRAQELPVLADLLRSQRLITLTGPGGTGKTRLGIAAAERAAAHFADGVAFVDLAAVTDARLAPAMIARALDLPETPGQTPEETLCAFLAGKRLLLILDNFEHLVDAAPIVPLLLSACPDLSVLVTSREPLRVSGEHELPLAPLPTPRAGQTSVASAERSDAVALFVERAAAVHPGFAVTAANAEIVIEICRRLDGLPLALELAAVRVRVFPVHTLLTQLQQRLGVLTDGMRDLPARQRTLRDTIAWSYDLLAPEEQQLFQQLSVFTGGCTVASAEAIAAVDGAAPQIVRLLSALTEKSLLVRRDGFDAEPRFAFLETIGEFAAERLADSQTARATRHRHARFFADLADAAEPHLRGPHASLWIKRLDDEHDNLRAALEWCIVDREAEELGCRIVRALRWFWVKAGYLAEGRAYAEQILAHDPRSQRREVRAGALLTAALAAWWGAGDTPVAARYTREAMDIYAELDDDENLGYGAYVLGGITRAQGDLAGALQSLAAAIAMFRARGDRWGLASALDDYGRCLHATDVATAVAAYEECVYLWKSLGDAWGLTRATYNFGLLLMRAGRADEAYTLYSEMLAQENGELDISRRGMLTEKLAELSIYKNELAQARRYIDEALYLYEEHGVRLGRAAALSMLGQITQLSSDYAVARDAFSESLQIYRTLDEKQGIASVLIMLALVFEDQSALERALPLFHEGLLLGRTIGSASIVAGALEVLAGVALRFQQPERAVRIFGAAALFRERSGMWRPLAYQSRYDRLLAAAQAALTGAAFAREWEAGRSGSLDQAVEEAIALTVHA
jgi:predicted ATPase/transcriptional regulator with XRE-family HTH domain